MNKYSHKRIFSSLCILLVFLIFSTSVNASENVINWYCIRNKSHKQPVLDASLSVIHEHGGIFANLERGDSDSDKVVYLTFDAGYENGNIEIILDKMKEADVKGAFFVLGNLIRSNADLVKRMFDEGHLVCNHTYCHKSMVNLSFDEFQRELSHLENACLECTGKELSKYYRPPEGRFDIESLEHAKSMGYKTVFWSIAYADWDNNNQMSEERAMAKILDNLHNGAIILLHPTSKTNASIMSKLIEKIKAEGYRFGSLDEIV